MLQPPGLATNGCNIGVSHHVSNLVQAITPQLPGLAIGSDIRPALAGDYTSDATLNDDIGSILCIILCLILCRPSLRSYLDWRRLVLMYAACTSP